MLLVLLNETIYAALNPGTIEKNHLRDLNQQGINVHHPLNIP